MTTTNSPDYAQRARSNARTALVCGLVGVGFGLLGVITATNIFVGLMAATAAMAGAAASVGGLVMLNTANVLLLLQNQPERPDTTPAIRALGARIDYLESDNR